MPLKIPFGELGYVELEPLTFSRVGWQVTRRRAPHFWVIASTEEQLSEADAEAWARVAIVNEALRLSELYVLQAQEILRGGKLAKR